MTEGGRRLFSEEDVATLETICFLRDLDISIKDIHTRFLPRKMEAVFGNHTPKMRKLTCPSCKRKIWSLEVHRREVNE